MTLSNASTRGPEGRAPSAEGATPAANGSRIGARARRRRLADRALEAETRLREAHHRIRNHLQLVVSLLSLQAREAGDPRLTDLLNLAGGRVMAIARLHEQLQAGSSEDVHAADLLASLCQDLDKAFGGPVAG